MLGLLISSGILMFMGYLGESLIMLGIFSFFFCFGSWEGLSYYFLSGLFFDNLGYSLSFLSVWIILLSILSSMGIFKMKKSDKVYIWFFFFLLVSLLLSFSFSNYLLFYVCFEVSLIPILGIILGWGYQPERSQSGIYMLFYTFFASLPLFFYILMLEGKLGSLWMEVGCEMSGSNMFDVLLIVAFLVKFPMYCLHLWLPKAHVEAPVGGSMILAGVLLKLGGYGLMRLSPLMVSKPFWGFYFVLVLSLFGSSLTSLICLRQVDMKSLVAYSSVVHMGMCIGCIMLMGEWGYSGVIYVMVGHGLCSSGLFCVCNVLYERTHSRSMWVNKGLLNLMPSMSLWWFLLVSGNMAAPPTLNLLGEISMIMSLLSDSFLNIFVVSMLCFFSACYSLYLYSFSQHGKALYVKSGYHSSSVLEHILMGMHWVPLNLLVLGGYLMS